MLQNLAKFQKFQLDNLVDFKKEKTKLKNAEKPVFSCKDRRRYNRKRAKFCTEIGNYPTGPLRRRRGGAAGGPAGREAGGGGGPGGGGNLAVPLSARRAFRL